MSPYREPPERESDPDTPTHPNETLGESTGCAVFFWAVFVGGVAALGVTAFMARAWPWFAFIAGFGAVYVAVALSQWLEGTR
jgi:hypothetical protein